MMVYFFPPICILPPPSNFYTFYVSFLSVSLLSCVTARITQFLMINSTTLFHRFISVLFPRCYSVKGLHFIFSVCALLWDPFLKHYLCDGVACLGTAKQNKTKKKKKKKKAFAYIEIVENSPVIQTIWNWN